MHTQNIIPLSVQNVVKSFAQGATLIRAVNQISLSVSPGDFVAVMGPSGSGKSTLLHLIAGLTTPDSGDVLIDGQKLVSLNDSSLTLFRRKKIGLIFQSYNLIPTLSALDNILLPALPDDNLNSRVEQLLVDLNLSNRKNHTPDALSGGEQQRVAIARALINQPSLLLADEPTGSLDSASSQSICQLLKHLADQGRSILLVTHEPSVASWAQRVVVLKDGQLIANFPVPTAGDASSLQSAYQNIVSSSLSSPCTQVEDQCGGVRFPANNPN